MNVNVNIVAANEETKQALDAMPANLRSFPAPSLAHVPLQGDLITFAEDMPVFEVANRLFIWRSPTELVLQLLLQLARMS